MSRDAAQGGDVVERFAYGPAPTGFADLRVPAGDGPHPVVILIHGGFWRARYGLDLMDRLGDDLAARGIASWNIEYRRVGEAGGGYPGTLIDVAAAAEMLRAVAADRALDLGRVITLGHSAGWQRKLGNGAVSDFIGGGADMFPERYAIADPALSLPLGIPQVLVHGLRDDIVPPIISELYLAAATRAGDDVRLRAIPDADHMAVIDPTTPAWAVIIEEVQRLLRIG
jgi:acetyl esterase/lipase